jgi:hypothetical protein
MKDVIAHIARRKRRIAAHPFYHWLASGDTPLAHRFDFAPILVNFIMGFSDMNRWFMRYENPSGDHERAINRHTHEDETHSRLFVEDWRKLGLDQRLGWTASDTLAWYHAAPATELFRAHAMDILRMLTQHEDPLVRFALMESIEAWGHVMFSATEVAATQLSESTGTQYRYFGSYHLKREIGHLLAADELFEREHLDDERRARAIALVERLFDIAEAESDALLRHAEQVIAPGRTPDRVCISQRRDQSPAAVIGDRKARAVGQTRLERLLEERKRGAAQHPLLTWMQHERRSDPQTKIRNLALFWAPDCLGYKDLNTHVLANPNPTSPPERALQRRVSGLASHHQLFLQDWAALGIDERLGFSASDTLDFYCRSSHSKVQRRSMSTFVELAFRHPDPALRFWLVEALEASGDAFFASTRRLALAVEAEHRIRLDYFANRHDHVHPELPRDVEAEQASFYGEPLDPEQEDAAAAIIHTVFDCLEAQQSASLAQATSGAFFSN